LRELVALGSSLEVKGAFLEPVTKELGLVHPFISEVVKAERMRSF
jgi:hypothetical protein